jgi:UDP-N-acetylglucosamine 2-epimerase (non-hydrolysing)
MKILSVIGARPNFMKIAPICDELKGTDISHTLVHTGQHYDYRMSKLFFEDLGLPKPDINLGVGSATHGHQTAEVMMRLEPVLEREKPSLVIVVGDINSTMAAAVTAVKLGIPVAHVEAGLRSFDRNMPEEINRVLTDAVSSFYFTTEESANDNLRKEGIPGEKIFFVGNTMIDTLFRHAERVSVSPILQNLGMKPREYGVVTLHRPSNVDSERRLRDILEALNEIAADLPIVFPVHPRTRKQIAGFGLEDLVTERGTDVRKGLYIIEPLGYCDFLGLVKEARIVFTDSGGIQEETTVLGIHCLTLRENTERPVTITSGTNVLVGAVKVKIISETRKRLNGFSASHICPPLWDGHAAERIVDIIKSRLS